MAQVLLLATMATKASEAEYLKTQLDTAGVGSTIIDISLQSGGKTLDGAAKCEAMAAAAEHALEQIGADPEVEVLLGIGGGTGGEIVLQVMRAMPITFPKLLITTLPFDPRPAMADNAITIIPTLADICGLNDMLRDVLQNAALMAAGLCRKSRKGELLDIAPSIGITGLGATNGAVDNLVKAFAAQNRETTVFHANGFGGAAFTRFAERSAFDAIIDLTPHEMTRLHITGPHVPMRGRFSAAPDLPRIVLPGGLNFLTVSQQDTLPAAYADRAHYSHSGYFTHVKATPDEMRLVTNHLAEALNAMSGPCAVILPLGGFSHHDRPGGAIEDRDLRHVCLEAFKKTLGPKVPLIAIDAHIADPEITEATLTLLDDLTKDTKCTT